MQNNKIDNVVNLTAPERYDYFIRKVTDFEGVWGLKDTEGCSYFIKDRVRHYNK